ncbi:hypothetical protein C8J56DRAFT_902593 [Mycena floridula]|nr:hypothetical protein C8J56DRAFT_902593 [Mycena floridula]
MSQAQSQVPDTLGRPVPVTHAQRHPELPVQPVKERVKKTISDAQKQSMAVGRAVAQEQRAKLHARLLDFVKEQEEKLELIAQEEGVTVAHCHDLLGTALKQKRKVNLHNALVSLKSAELNEDRAPGEKLKLKEIQAAVAADETMKDVSTTEAAKVKELLAEKRLLKAQGARVSHASEAKDITAFMRRMADESFNLHQRTGAISFGFVTRAAVDCTATPGWWATGNATDFVKEKLNVTMWDLMRTFETWTAAALGPLGSSLHNVADRKAECAAIILSNLRYITHSRDISMSYTHYDRDLVVAQKVHLVGWPHGVPFRAPSTLTRAGDIRALLEALQCGSCYWTKSDPKPRKRRSDSGQQHTKKRKAADGAGDDDGDSGRPAGKKRRTGVEKPKAPSFLSPETVASDADDN